MTHQLMRSVHDTKDGVRYGHLTHLAVDGRPVCKFANRIIGNNSYPQNWILEIGEQPSCVTCARRAEQLKGGAA